MVQVRLGEYGEEKARLHGGKDRKGKYGESESKYNDAIYTRNGGIGNDQSGTEGFCTIHCGSGIIQRY